MILENEINHDIDGQIVSFSTLYPYISDNKFLIAELDFISNK